MDIIPDDYNDDVSPRKEVLLDVVKIILCIIIIVLSLCIANKYYTTQITMQKEKTIDVVRVVDLFKNKDEYYMTVYDDKTFTVYNIPVNTYEFITYKIDDELEIIISNGKARIYSRQEND